MNQDIWLRFFQYIDRAKARGLLEGVLEGKLEGLFQDLREVNEMEVKVSPSNELVDLLDASALSSHTLSASYYYPSSLCTQHPQDPPTSSQMTIHFEKHRDLITKVINTLDPSAPATTTTTTASDNYPQRTVAVSAPAEITMSAQHQDLPVSAPVAREAQEVVTTTTTTTAAATTTAMSGPGRSDPTAAAASSTATPAPQTKKSKKNAQKKKRRKVKARLEKQREAEEHPVMVVSKETPDQASPPGTVPPSRVSSPGIRSSLETLLLVPAAEVRPEGNDLEDVVAWRSATPLTPPTPAYAGSDEADPPSSPITAAATTMTAANPPSPSSSVDTEDRQLWHPWWNLNYHGKTLLTWQHEDGRREPTTLSALTRSNPESPCLFNLYCQQHAANTLCWCPECQTVPRWCCCAHYTSYCTMDPRPQGQGLIIASWPKQSASRAAPVGVQVGASAAPAETTAMSVPEHGLAAEETLFKGQMSAVPEAASECDPETDLSTSLFVPTSRPGLVVRRLSWPITFCSAEERYPM